MTGPIQPDDAAYIEAHCANEALAGIEVREGRSASVGRATVRRVLPTKGRRTVGAWCFLDMAEPEHFDRPHPMEVGPHPHYGLATVTWLLEGEVLHTDSLGTEQVIRADQLNLMHAGHGIAHAEQGLSVGGTRGIQMWLAQPDRTREDRSRFQHVGDLPRVELAGARDVADTFRSGGGDATIFVGSAWGATSTAQVDTPLIGADLTLRGGSTVVEADPTFEYAVVPLDRPVRVAQTIVEPGAVGLIPVGADHLPLAIGGEDPGADTTGRLLLLGGEPLGEDVFMWWNFVARTREEVEAAYRAWRDHDTDRFGDVPTDLARLGIPRPVWMTED